MTEYTLAYSPCPNDTYVFAALTNGLLDGAPAVRVHLADIEELNTSAARGEYELTKVSYGAIPFLMDRYRILPSGGALGRANGPLLVALPGEAPPLFADFAHKRIAIPGEHTTAYLLLQLALGARPKTVAMRFDRIVPAVLSGEVDAGLIIHESRFTYRDAGLISIADLGEWWENMTLLPTPLGAILIRNDVGDAQAREIDGAIRRSLAFARANEAAIMPYVREHAIEMSDEVMRAHIELYVNDYTEGLGETGRNAVRALFSRAHDGGHSAKRGRAVLRRRFLTGSAGLALADGRTRRRRAGAVRSDRTRRRGLPPLVLALPERSQRRRHHQPERRHLAARIDRRRDSQPRRHSPQGDLRAGTRLPRRSRRRRRGCLVG